MTGYGFYRSIRFLLFLGVLALVGAAVWVGIILSLVSEVSREVTFHHRYGDTWKTQYEDQFGSLEHAHSRMIIGVIAIVAMAVTIVWSVKALNNQRRPHGSTSRRHKSRGSSIERRVRYKRNALLGVYFGVPGILFSVVLAVFRMGIFAQHSDEVVLAIFVFIGAYCAVINGCYWWLKAKAWTESVVIIAFMPLIVFLIPFVRVLVFQALGLLAAVMVMMPLILVVVVAALPDKSGHSRRRAEWER